MIQKPTAILFDWDNTIVNTWSILHTATNKTLEKYNLPVRTIEQIKNNAYKSLRESFPSIFGNNWQEAATFFYQAINEFGIDQLETLPGSFELLHFINTANIPMGIVSNKLNTFLQKEISHLQWDYFFKVVVGSGDASKDKPNPEPIQLALQHMQKKADLNIWYVGDMEGDWECAKASNCQPIAIYRKPQDSTVPFFENSNALQTFLSNLL